MPSDPPRPRAVDESGSGPRASTWFAIVVLAGVGALVVWRAFIAPAPPAPSTNAPSAPSASAVVVATSAPSVAACIDVASEAMVIGEAPKRDAKDVDGGDDDDDALAPFAVEVGHGAAFDGGFAAGALREMDGATVSFVATVDAEGKNTKLVKLGKSRGDLDPPVVAGAGKSILAVLVEPNAGGKSIRVARVTGGDVAWGIELKQGHDDVAIDLAASGTHGAIAWESLGENDKGSEIRVESFDMDTMQPAAKARAATPPSVEATAPRLISRPAGYWLFYLARPSEDARREAKAQAKKDSKKPAKDKADPTTPRDDEEEDVDESEGDETSWVEVQPLDETGAKAGAAKALTSKTGHVAGFDAEVAADGGAMVAWRDDDASSGASGGRLFTAIVRASGAVEPHEITKESGSSGLPDLLPGFLAITSLSAKTRVAPISANGEALADLAADPLLKSAQPIAAKDGAILLAEPAGRAMRLRIVRCGVASSDAGAPSP